MNRGILCYLFCSAGSCLAASSHLGREKASLVIPASLREIADILAWSQMVLATGCTQYVLVAEEQEAWTPQKEGFKPGFFSNRSLRADFKRQTFLKRFQILSTVEWYTLYCDFILSTSYCVTVTSIYFIPSNGLSNNENQKLYFFSATVLAVMTESHWFPFEIVSLILPASLLLSSFFRSSLFQIPALFRERFFYTLFICSLLDRSVKFGHEPGRVIKFFVVKQSLK